MVKETVAAKYPATLVARSDVGFYANQEGYTLAAAITDAQTVWTFESVGGLVVDQILTRPGANGLEVARITAVDAGQNQVTVVRDQDGGLASAHGAGVPFKATLIAKGVNQLFVEVAALEAELGATGSQNFLRTDGTEDSTGLQAFTAGIKTNTVAENTAAAGVTVDGALVKDGGATLKDTTTWIVDGTDATKRLNIDVAGTTNITGVLQTGFTTAKTVTIPDIAGTLASLAGAQTFTGAKTFTGGLLSDTVAEASAGVGVTVDGLLLKDAGIGAAATHVGLQTFGDGLATIGATTGAAAMTAETTGDTQKRLIVDAGGNLKFGSGSATQDIQLGRGSSDRLDLASGDTLRIVGGGGTLETDTINETTPAAGVTVDGLLLKDAGIGAAATHAGLQTFSGGIAADTIAEVTPAAGVTVDGLLLKDSVIGGASDELAFFGVTKVPRAAAYTQTYSTADRTLAAYTADTESVAYTGIDNAQGGTVYATAADLNALRVAYENLRAFVEDAVGVINAHTDDLQAYGLLQ